MQYWLRAVDRVESASRTEITVRYDCFLSLLFVVCCCAMGPVIIVIRASSAHLTAVACYAYEDVYGRLRAYQFLSLARSVSAYDLTYR
jgi:hypothetical protein